MGIIPFNYPVIDRCCGFYLSNNNQAISYTSLYIAMIGRSTPLISLNEISFIYISPKNKTSGKNFFDIYTELCVSPLFCSSLSPPAFIASQSSEKKFFKKSTISNTKRNREQGCWVCRTINPDPGAFPSQNSHCFWIASLQGFQGTK